MFLLLGIAGAATLAVAATSIAGLSGLGAPVAPLTGTSVVVSGIPSCPVTPGFHDERDGPLALLDDGKYLFFTDACNDTLYRLPDTGGSIAKAKRMKLTALVVAMVKAGTHYYIAKFGTDANAGLWEFDPTTLALRSTAPKVAVPDIRWIAVDPKTHDVFATSDQKIVRIHNLNAATPRVTTFGQPATGLYDGIAFTPSGSMLYTTDRYNYPNIHILEIDRTGKKVLDIVDPAQGEGLAVAKSGLLFVNNNGTDGSSPATYGSVSTLAPNATTLTTVATGGSRGGFATVDCKGFMLVDQTTSIVRIAPALFAKNAGAGACTSLVKH